MKFSLLSPDVTAAPILFYNRGEPYYEFTNFANYPIVVDGVQYRTSEHYFQAQKFQGTPYVVHVAQLARPRDAFDFTRRPDVQQWIRKDWHTVKEDVMYRGLMSKFQQHPELQAMLLNTGNRKLVEHSPHDSYWGDGPDGRGLNRLGELLMRVRRRLRESVGVTGTTRHSIPQPPPASNLFSTAGIIGTTPGSIPQAPTHSGRSIPQIPTHSLPSPAGPQIPSTPLSSAGATQSSIPQAGMHSSFVSVGSVVTKVYLSSSSHSQFILSCWQYWSCSTLHFTGTTNSWFNLSP